MTITAFRAESFRPQREAQPALTRDDLQNARAEGFAQGHQAALEGLHGQVVDQLGAISDQLADTQTAIAQTRVDLIRSLAPLLNAIIDQCVSSHMADRLAQVLTAELSQLARQTSPGGLTIRCDPETARWLDAAGGNDLIEVTPSDSLMAEICLPGGRVSFDTAAVIESMKTLVATLTEDME